jgi:hypothetical protein
VVSMYLWSRLSKASFKAQSLSVEDSR